MAIRSDSKRVKRPFYNKRAFIAEVVADYLKATKYAVDEEAQTITFYFSRNKYGENDLSEKVTQLEHPIFAEFERRLFVEFVVTFIGG